MNTKTYLDVCRRLEKADIVLKNASIINVFTKEVIKGDLAIKGNKIIGIGDYSGVEEIDLKGRYVAPGFIDSHIHIESSMLLPSEFAKVVLPFGTTTLIADPHEIANVSGLDGVRYMLEKSEESPVHIYYMLPSCVPATMMESSGAILEAAELKTLINHPQVLGLGEVMNYPGVILGDTKVLAKLEAFDGKIIDGHAPGVSGYDLTAYAFAGIQTDHECSTIEEARQRIRLGMTVQIRKGSAANNLKPIVSGLVEEGLPLQSCIFCTDDKHLEHIMEEGHIDSNIRESIQLGIPPIEAICMATLYAAKTYHLQHKGAIAPGYDADLVIFDTLEDIRVTQVMCNGDWVYDQAQPHEPNTTSVPFRYDADTKMLNTIACDHVTAQDLAIPLTHPYVHVIALLPHEILTQKVIEAVPLKEGFFEPNTTYSKLAVIERHHRTGRCGLGITKHFNIKGGAIAQTIAHDSHNIICIGDNDQDMALAINTLITKQGGIVIVRNGEVIEDLNLPIAGLMSTLSAKQVVAKLKRLLACAAELGINTEIDPFLTLAFLALPVIPEIKMTDQGLFDVSAFKHIPVQAEKPL